MCKINIFRAKRQTLKPALVCKKRAPGSHCNRGAEYGKVSAESDSEFFAEACNLRAASLLRAFIVGCCCHGVVYFEIELDFRFCSGRSDAHFGAVGSEILQHIGGRGEVHLGHFAGAAVSYIKVGVVLDEHNIGAIEFLGGLARKSFIIFWISSAPVLPVRTTETPSSWL